MYDDYTPVGRPAREWPLRPPVTEANTMYFFAAVGLVVMSLLVYIERLVMPDWFHLPFYATTSVAFYVLAMGWPVTRYARGNPGTAEGMRLKRPRAVFVVIALLTALVGVMVSGDLGTLWMIGIEALGGRIPASGSTLAALPIALQLFFMAILPGVCEEWLFRGAILSAYERYGIRRALLASTVLFAILHGNLAGLPIQLLIGLAIGLLVVASDSVVVGMVYHAAHNALLLLLSGDAVPGESLIEALGGMREVVITAVRFVALGLVMAGLIGIAWYLGARARRAKPTFAPSAPLPAWSIIVLAAGIVTALCMYAINLLNIFGGRL